ncbi:MAG: hypothetical protein J0M07_17640, partial [Anaerolineae bacterium]|nr:hypothetical protein [Anaerolineae bacterium]
MSATDQASKNEASARKITIPLNWRYTADRSTLWFRESGLMSTVQTKSQLFLSLSGLLRHPSM